MDNLFVSNNKKQVVKQRTMNKTGWILKSLKRDKYLFLMLIPFIVYYLIFVYKPFYFILVAFKDYSPFLGFSKSPWVGLKYFKMLTEIPNLWKLVRNTVQISIYSFVIGFPAPIIVALLFNELRNKTYKKVVQTMTFLPHFISSVIIVGLVYNFLSPSQGLINQIIQNLGGSKIYFLMEKDWFRTIYISMGVWASAGFGAIIYLAALSGVDPQLYEAAVIDGARRWKQTIHITIPSIMPTVVTMLILSIGGLLSVGAEGILLLYQPATYEKADVISTYIYRYGLQQGNYSIATALDVVNSVISLILVLIANFISKRVSENYLF